MDKKPQRIIEAPGVGRLTMISRQCRVKARLPVRPRRRFRKKLIKILQEARVGVRDDLVDYYLSLKKGYQGGKRRPSRRQKK